MPYRPYGATLLMASYDKNGPALYAIDPSGTALVRGRGSVGRRGRGAEREGTGSAGQYKGRTTRGEGIQLSCERAGRGLQLQVVYLRRTEQVRLAVSGGSISSYPAALLRRRRGQGAALAQPKRTCGLSRPISYYPVSLASPLQRYFGTAVGKGRQAAKNEIEKLKLGEMSAREAVIEAVKMWVDAVWGLRS